MIVYCSNNASAGFKRLYADFPDRVGWLLGPSSYKNPYPGMRYALDNDAFGAWKNGIPWDEAAWFRLLDKARKIPRKPEWVLVPDEVANAEETIRKWHTYKPIVVEHGFTPAFAVQDGMSPGDVPGDARAGVIFVGGSTRWKWKTVRVWAKGFNRVHVGRVRQRGILLCYENGVESTDGTGWFRESDSGRPIRWLRAFLANQIQPHPAFGFYHE